MIVRTVLLALIALVITVTPGRAEIRIETAQITQGHLVITGRTSPNQRVVLDENYSTTADNRGRFRFQIEYMPTSCIGTLKAGTDMRRVVIANCAPQGEPGPQGPKGDPGPQGPKGDPGVQGHKADSLSGGRIAFIESALSHFAIFCYLAALGVYLWARPAWRNMGPSLSDSFVIGLALFASGSIFVWVTWIPYSFEVMMIAVTSGIFGTAGAALWSVLFRRRIAELQFFSSAAQMRASAADHVGITAGLAISALVCLLFLVQAFSHDHVRSLLIGAIFEGKSTLNEARVIMSAGTEGYFAPGYVKQFRDVLVPMLCTAALLCHGSYNNKPLFYGSLLTALIAMFISGQRLVLIELTLCLAAGFLLDLFRTSQPRLMPAPFAAVTFFGMVALVGLMTQMLGRVDTPLTPVVEQPVILAQPTQPAEQTAAMEQQTTERQARRPIQPAQQTAGMERPAIERQATGPIQSVEQKAARERRATERQSTVPEETAPSSEQTKATPKHPQSKEWNRSDLPLPLAAAITIAHRSVMAVPQENAVSYGVWGPSVPTFGRGWWTEISSIRPGTQFQLSNELSEATKPSLAVKGNVLGNSPLGLPTDLYYNWGFPGLVTLPVLYALCFLLLDIILIRSLSPLLYAAKLLLFFSIPFMYSPFLFILYGGAAVLALAGYVFVSNRWRSPSARPR